MSASIRLGFTIALVMGGSVFIMCENITLGQSVTYYCGVDLCNRIQKRQPFMLTASIGFLQFALEQHDVDGIFSEFGAGIGQAG